MGLYSTLNLTSGKTWKKSCSQLFICLTWTTVCTWLFNCCSICFSTLLCGRLHMPSGQYSILSDEQEECCWHSKSFKKPQKWKRFYKTWLSLHFVQKAQILIETAVIVFPFKILFLQSQVVLSICSYQW